jgi:hypothetical protein
LLHPQAAGVERGAMKPGHDVTGYLTRKHIYEIAKIKSQVPEVVLFLSCSIIPICVRVFKIIKARKKN